jgi:hypothetical protein
MQRCFSALAEIARVFYYNNPFLAAFYAPGSVPIETFCLWQINIIEKNEK